MDKSIVINTLKGWGINSKEEMLRSLADDDFMEAVGFQDEDQAAIESAFFNISKGVYHD